jgi:hypothetical protein
MKKFNQPEKFIAILLLTIAFAGCKKEDDPSTSNNSNTNNTGGGGNNDGSGAVYVCGGVNTGSSTDWYPRYWKDGEEHVVGDGSRGHAYDIWADDENVIIAGSVYDGGLTMPCYWINEDFYELNNYACGDCAAEDVFVAGSNDVHMAGHVRIENEFSTIQKAMYWNNGVGTELTNGADDARAYGVHVDNNNVYVCGYEKDGPGGRKRAKYWLNGEQVVLGDGEEDSEARAIWVQDGNVYVAGYEEIDLFNLGETLNYPVLWFNGVRNVLGSIKGEAEGIYVEGNDVYVVGYTQPMPGSNLTFGCYWVNDVINDIYTSVIATNGSHGNGIFVKDNVIHTAQNYFGPSGSAGHYAKHPNFDEEFLGDVAWSVYVH